LHPGIQWYLKTIIPNENTCTDSAFALLNAIKAIQHHDPTLILITEAAFNWDQQYMPHWHSLWVRSGYDINFTLLDDNTIDYEITKQDQLYRENVAWYLDLVQSELVRNPSKQYRRELNHLTNTLQLQQTHTTNAQAEEKRAQFKVIDGGKIST
jgi:hypothetical protein